MPVSNERKWLFIIYEPVQKNISFPMQSPGFIQIEFQIVGITIPLPLVYF